MLPDFMHFILGGGLLALLQAIFGFIAMFQAKRQGVLENAAATQSEVSKETSVAKAIETSVAVEPSSNVSSELRQFERD